MINVDDMRRLVNAVTTSIGMQSPVATNLLLGTMAQESNGHYLYQLGSGPARGLFQMEPDTEKDIWDNYIAYRPFIKEMITRLTGVTGPNGLQLTGNIVYQIIMARLHYRRVKEKFPAPNDIPAIGVYWKKYYNTVKGKGRVSEFIRNYNRYINSEEVED